MSKSPVTAEEKVKQNHERQRNLRKLAVEIMKRKAPQFALSSNYKSLFLESVSEAEVILRAVEYMDEVHTEVNEYLDLNPWD
ncbi:MAG: hypothetical protein ACAH17_00900 [Candidatus Paceibacterota bacterium]